MVGLLDGLDLWGCTASLCKEEGQKKEHTVKTAQKKCRLDFGISKEMFKPSIRNSSGEMKAPK